MSAFQLVFGKIYSYFSLKSTYIASIGSNLQMPSGMHDYLTFLCLQESLSWGRSFVESHSHPKSSSSAVPLPGLDAPGSCAARSSFLLTSCRCADVPFIPA